MAGLSEQLCLIDAINDGVLKDLILEFAPLPHVCVDYNDLRMGVRDVDSARSDILFLGGSIMYPDHKGALKIRLSQRILGLKNRMAA